MIGHIFTSCVIIIHLIFGTCIIFYLLSFAFSFSYFPFFISSIFYLLWSLPKQPFNLYKVVVRSTYILLSSDLTCGIPSCMLLLFDCIHMFGFCFFFFFYFFVLYSQLVNHLFWNIIVFPFLSFLFAPPYTAYQMY